MKRILLLLSLWMVSATQLVYSQSNDIDSLREVLSKSKEDSFKVKTLNSLGYKLANIDPQQVFEIAGHAEQLSKKLGYARGLAIVYNLRGIAYQNLANYDSAFYCYSLSLKEMEKSKDLRGIAICYNNIGMLLEDFFQDHKKALECQLKSLEIKEKMNNRKGIAATYDNIGHIYKNQGKYKEAIQYYEQALPIMEEFKDLSGVVTVFNGLGDSYKGAKEYARALEYYNKALGIVEQLGETQAHALTLYNIGSTYSLQKLYKKSNEKIKLSIELATQVKAKDILQKCYEVWSVNSENTRQPALALEYHKKAMFFKDSIYKENRNKQMAAMNMNLGYELKEKEVASLNEQKKEEAQLRYIMIGGIMLVSGFVFVVYRANKRMKEVNKTLNKQKIEIESQRDTLEEKTNSLQHANEEIIKQKEEIESQRDNIENQKNQITQALDDIKLLSKIGQELTASLDFETTFVRMYQYVIDLMNADCFRVMIRNDEKNVLEDTYCIERGVRLPAEAIPLEEEARLSVICAKRNEAIFISNYPEEYKKYTPQLQITVTEAMPHSIIYLPLTIDEKVIGVITVQSFEKNAYNEYELNVLKTLAAYAAIALDNANAYQQISLKNEIIAEKNKSITDSLRYAETMQKALLPNEDLFKKLFREHFILYMPKDIVSGDFYWCAVVGDKTFVAVVDCTGHGVPGAFMSLIGISLLNEIVKQRHIHSPALILEELHKGIQAALNQENKTNDDGMDVCLCRLEHVPYDSTKVTFAGAKRPLLYKTANSAQLNRIKGDNKPIGGWHKASVSNFSNHEILLNSGDTLYLITDGLADQDNENREKFGMERLTTLLESYTYLNLQEQKQEIMHELITYRRARAQRDDISMMAIKL